MEHFSFFGKTQVSAQNDIISPIAFTHGYESLCCAAFDRDDALYLQDEAEKARHKELELRDAEMGKFTRLRSEVDIDSGAKGDDMWLSSSTYKRAKLVKCASASTFVHLRCRLLKLKNLFKGPNADDSLDKLPLIDTVAVNYNERIVVYLFSYFDSSKAAAINTVLIKKMSNNAKSFWQY